MVADRVAILDKEYMLSEPSCKQRANGVTSYASRPALWLQSLMSHVDA